MNKDATEKQLVFVGRLSVALVALVAVFLAYDRNSSILTLVSNAWAGFGAAFGPLVILSLYWKKMNSNGALAGMLTGAVTVLIWIYAPITINGQSLSSVMYEIVPGFIMATIAIVVVSRFTTKEQPELEAVFEQVAAKH